MFCFQILGLLFVCLSWAYGVSLIPNLSVTTEIESPRITNWGDWGVWERKLQQFIQQQHSDYNSFKINNNNFSIFVLQTAQMESMPQDLKSKWRVMIHQFLTIPH